MADFTASFEYVDIVKIFLACHDKNGSSERSPVGTQWKILADIALGVMPDIFFIGDIVTVSKPAEHKSISRKHYDDYKKCTHCDIISSLFH